MASILTTCWMFGPVRSHSGDAVTTRRDRRLIDGVDLAERGRSEAIRRRRPRDCDVAEGGGGGDCSRWASAKIRLPFGDGAGGRAEDADEIARLVDQAIGQEPPPSEGGGSGIHARERRG